MTRLVVVSNRIADLVQPTQSGGLAVALTDALKERGGVWLGWDGNITERSAGAAVESIGNVKAVSMSFSQSEYDQYYGGFANSVLWPLLHYRLDLIDYQPEHFDTYMKVNRRFANELTGLLDEDDVIWVQDYHLIPLAAFLRASGCHQRIGFFLHVPFPSPDILTASPHHRELIDALLQYDVIGFQTHVDASNLKHYLTENTKAEIADDGTVEVDGRNVLIERFPIGIDVSSFEELAKQVTEEIKIDMLRRQLLGRRQIIGVDRLDYSKGLPQRFSAFDRFLQQNPEHERSVSLLQIAPPTREDVEAYSQIREELEALNGAINGRFADFNWTPIRYIHRTVPRPILAVLYRFSEVGLVTPLRDGMNLVAKEYVAAQDPDNPGVLVLSKFAGAAEEMGDALLVNPYDVDQIATTLRQALNMPLEERKERHAALLRSVREFDATNWMRKFLDKLDNSPRQYVLPQSEQSQPVFKPNHPQTADIGFDPAPGLAKLV